MNIYIVVYMFLLYFISINISYDKRINYSIDKTIEELRDKYKSMKADNRFSIDICNTDDRFGDNRNSINVKGTNCEPWMSRECIYVLNFILPYNGIGLEWSSGSSTLWLGYRLKQLLSVENNKDWYEIVKQKIERKKINKKIKIMLIEKDNLSSCRNDKKLISQHFENETCFKTYVTSIKIPDIQYDFISIDGRARTGCMMRAIKMIKQENGIIIIDNAERERYNWVYKFIPAKWSTYDYWYNKELVKMFITHT